MNELTDSATKSINLRMIMLSEESQIKIHTVKFCLCNIVEHVNYNERGRSVVAL